MYNSLIRQGYLNAYLDQVQRYQFEYRGSVVTYYKLNKDKSTYDSNLLVGGSYERVGKLSSLKFDKIINFYVSGSSEIIPTLNAEEKGVLVDYRTTVMFPNVFEPTMYDFLQFTINNEQVGPLFQIVNFQLAFIQPKVKFYKCDIKGVGIPVEEINKQIIDNYGYIDIDHRIHQIEEYNKILQALSNITSLESEIECDYITSSILVE